MITLLYFAWVRAKIGIGRETVTPPADVVTVASLIDWLETRGANYRAALGARAIIKAAVNQSYVDPSHPIKAGDEVALFPPVTGG